MIAAAIAKKSPTHTAARSARPSLAIEDRHVVPAIGQSMEFAQDSSRWHNARDILRRQHRFAVPCLERRRRVEEPVLRPVRTPGRGDKHVARRRRQPAEHMHCHVVGTAAGTRPPRCPHAHGARRRGWQWGPGPQLLTSAGAGAGSSGEGWSWHQTSSAPSSTTPASSAANTICSVCASAELDADAAAPPCKLVPFAAAACSCTPGRRTLICHYDVGRTAAAYCMTPPSGLRGG